MRAKWLAWSLIVAVALAGAAARSGAQRAPAEAPPDGVGDSPGEAVETAWLDDLEDVDGLGGLLVAAIGPGPRGGMGRPAHARHPMGRGRADIEALHEKLKLTEEQRAKLADIHDRAERAVVPIRADLRIASLDLHKLLRADKPDRPAIETQIDRMGSLRASLQKAHVASMLEARGTLTAAQQKILRESHRGPMGPGSRGGMRGGKHGGMHGPPGGW